MELGWRGKIAIATGAKAALMQMTKALGDEGASYINGVMAPVDGGAIRCI